MDVCFKYTKRSLAVFPLVLAALVSGCGSGCGTLGVANTSSCGDTTSSMSATSSTYSISGAVSGSSIPSVTLTLTGAGTGTTSTTNGTYTFTALPNGSYNVVPSLSGYAFTPVSTAVTISGGDQTAVSFAATPNAAATYSISGTVSGTVEQNVLITLTSGSITTGTAVTDPNGSYLFSGLAAGTYTVAPSLSGYTFTPASSAATLSSGTPTATIPTFNEAAN